MFAANAFVLGQNMSSVYSMKSKLAWICINVSIKPSENQYRNISPPLLLSAGLPQLTATAKVSRSGVKFVNRPFFPPLSTDMKLQLGIIEQKSCLSGGRGGGEREARGE